MLGWEIVKRPVAHLLLVNISPVVHFVDEKKLFIFVDLENDPYSACPHS
jgi:hypothetical protein